MEHSVKRFFYLQSSTSGFPEQKKEKYNAAMYSQN